MSIVMFLILQFIAIIYINIEFFLFLHLKVCHNLGHIVFVFSLLHPTVCEAEDDVDAAEDEDGDDVREEGVMILFVMRNLLEHMVVMIMAEACVEDNDEDDGEEEVDRLEKNAGGQGGQTDGLQGTADDKDVGVAQEDLGQV